MARGRGLSVLLAACLLANALTAPVDDRWRRADNEVDSKEDSHTKSVSTTTYTSRTTTNFNDDDDDDDDFSDSTTAAPSGGSNIFSLLRLAGALVPSLSSSNQLHKMISNPTLQNIIKEFKKLDQNIKIQPRVDSRDNEIEIDDSIHIPGLKPPPLQRQETETEESDEDSSESDENDDDEDDNDEDDNDDDEDDNDDDDNDDDDDGTEENTGAEVDSAEKDSDKNDNGNDKQDSNSNETGESDYDSDEPPEGDGMGGGILGLLAGLSGGEDGNSDLGSLLAAVSGIVGNLSGDGFDLNALIASGLGLFVGLLSEGEENPGAVIASYLLTSLETFTGGGANNNGAFFGKFISKLIQGTSAADPEGSSEEDGNKMPMKDSAGFFSGLFMGLLGEMSKGSSSGSSQPWERHDLHSWIHSNIR